MELNHDQSLLRYILLLYAPWPAARRKMLEKDSGVIGGVVQRHIVAAIFG